VTLMKRQSKPRAGAGRVEARELIVEAARAHFAEHGLQGSSLRRITQKAGVNIALISYHFGSKQKLFEGVLADCVERLNRPRLHALEKLERKAGSQAVAIEDLLAAYVLPYRLTAEEKSVEARIYIRFFGRLFTEPTDEMRRMLRTPFAGLHESYAAAFSRSLPHVPRKDLYYRFTSMNGAIAFMFVETGALELMSNGLCSTKPATRFWREFVRNWADMLSAPVSSKRIRS
jgi:AcrR family transcriptional regulator